MLSIQDLKIEYRKNPLGIDAKEPRISWKLSSEQKDTLQKSYHIVVKKEENIVWDSLVVESGQSICIKYAGEALEACTRYQVDVAVTDNYGNEARKEAYFETGLMEAKNWKADWITHGFEEELEPCAVFQKRFALKTAVKKARVYASALGIYEFSVNNRPGSDIHFAPGWTSYQSMVQYQTYDITELLQEENEILFTVGNGWYKGILGFFNQGNHYGTRSALIAQIEIEYMDGTREIFGTDESWSSTTKERRYSEIYHGEIIDFTQTENEIRPAVIMEQSKEVLIAQQNEPVRITERRKAEKLILHRKKKL